jgi:hypothetical protein
VYQGKARTGVDRRGSPYAASPKLNISEGRMIGMHDTWASGYNRMALKQLAARLFDDKRIFYLTWLSNA